MVVIGNLGMMGNFGIPGGNAISVEPLRATALQKFKNVGEDGGKLYISVEVVCFVVAGSVNG